MNPTTKPRSLSGTAALDRPGRSVHTIADKPWTRALLTCLIVLAPGLASAEKADRDKPIQVEADRMEYDDSRKVNTFTGRVLMTQGTIRIRADRLVVRQDPEGNQYGLAEGQPASFRQKREGLDEFIEGYGQTIDYNGKTEVVTLSGQASLKRLQGNTLTDEVFGTRIIYQGRSEFYTVESNPAGERVRVMIQPKRSTETTAPAAQPPATLKPSPSLAKPPTR